MKRISIKFISLLLGLLALVLTPSLSRAQSPGIEFKIASNGSVFEVFMRPNFTPNGGTLTLTAQVTIKVPTGTGANQFQVNSLNNTIPGVFWSLSSRVNAPPEDSNFDYLSFTPTISDPQALLAGRTANQEFKVFTFQNSAACLPGGVNVMNNNDPFNTLPNSAGTNPGNNFDILDLTPGGPIGDIYIGNYDAGLADCTKSDLTISVGQPSPTLTHGITSSLPITVTNNGPAVASGPTTVTLPLPAGVTAPASFTSGPWSCTTSGSTVTCTNPNPINNGTSSPISVPVTPGPSAVGTTPTFQPTVTTPNELNPANNTASPITTAPVAGSPDLVTSLGQPAPALKDGLQSSLPVTVTNNGTAPTSGPSTTTVTLPAGVTAPASFTSGPWSCTTSGTTVTCTNPNPINNGTSSPISVPVTPGPSTVGTTPTFNATTATPGESNNTNNAASPLTPSSPVAGSPNLTLTVGQPTPALKDGITSSLPVTVTNSGTAPTSGTTSVSVAMPAGMTAPASFTSGPWSCTTSGQTVTCTNPNPINNGASSPVSIPITPGPGNIGPSAVITPTVTPPGGTPTVLPPAPIGSVGGSPNVTVALGQPSPALKEGVQSNLPVTVTNSGTAPTSGPTTVTLPLPAGVTAPASFTSGPWTCTTSAGTITCINPNPINTGATSSISLPVTPGAGTGGTAPTFQPTVTSPGEKGPSIESAPPLSLPIAVNQSTLPIKVFLGGAYNSATGLIRDDFRAQNLIPTAQPYSSSSGFTHVNGGGSETTTAAVLAVTGNNAIVDWVFIELRSAANNTVVVGTLAALVQRDGDVVGVDGVSAPQVPAGLSGQSLFVAVRHRNHLGVMTASAVALSTTTALVDFTTAATPVFGTNAQKVVGAVRMLWSGNANANTTTINSGPNNDTNVIRATVLTAPGNNDLLINFIVSGYRATDVNMDGKTLAAGPNNDTNSILVSVFTHPANLVNRAANYIISQQLP